MLKIGEMAIGLEKLGKFFCPADLGTYVVETEKEVQILECFPPAWQSGSRSREVIR